MAVVTIRQAMTSAQIGASTIVSSDTGTLAESATALVAHAGSTDSATIAETQTVTPSGVAAWRVEDFSTYTNTANLIADPNTYYSTAEDDFPAGAVTLDTTTGVNINGFSLTQSMKYVFQPNGCTSQTVGRNFMFPGDTHGSPSNTTVTEIWTELYLKWSSNFSTVCSGCGCGGPPAHKLVFHRTTGLFGRYDNEWGNNGPPTQILVGWPSSGGGVQDVLASTDASSYWDGNWHQVRYHIKLSSTTSASDGVYQLSADGVTKYNNTAINIDCNTAIYGVALGRNMDQSDNSHGTMSINWGRIALYNTDPGWTF